MFIPYPGHAKMVYMHMKVVGLKDLWTLGLHPDRFAHRPLLQKLLLVLTAARRKVGGKGWMVFYI